MTISVDITSSSPTNWGGPYAVGDGATDDAPSFRAFNTWALANQGTDSINLLLPSGKTFYFNSGDLSNNNWGYGINTLTVSGYGATLKMNVAAAHVFFFGFGPAQYQDQTHVARTYSVAAGATQVRLKSIGDAALFSTLSYALLTGLDVQGPGNFPTNTEWFEYVWITAISGDTLTVRDPVQNDYKDSWPNYPASPGQVDPGGPATLYALQPFKATHLYQGFTVDAPTFATKAAGEIITFQDVTTTSGTDVFPSENNTYTLTTCTINNSTEVDKNVETVTINGGTFGVIGIQSPTPGTLNINSTSGMTLTGTPRKTNIANCTGMTFRPGTTSYGGSVSTRFANTTVASWPVSGGWTDAGPGAGGINAPGAFTMSGGIMTIPVSVDSPILWAVPGDWMFFKTNYDAQYPFQVLDVSRDATNTYIKTNLPGGFPVLAGATYLSVRTHPSFVSHFDASTVLLDSNGNPCIYFNSAIDGRPLYEYFRAQLSTSVLAPPGFPSWGQLKSVKVNIVQPYTGPRSHLELLMVQDVIKADGSSYIYAASVDLKTGPRVITITNNGVTGTAGADSALAVDSGGYNWFADNYSMAIFDVSADNAGPVVTVEVETDQGIPGAIAAPSPSAPQHRRHHGWYYRQ